MSLRARLLIGLVVLAAVGLIAAGLTTYAEQRSFLYARVDQQVAASQFLVGGQFGVLKGLAPRPLQQRRPPGPRPTTFQASATYGLLLGADGRVLEQKAFTYGTAAASPPALPARLPRSRLGSTRIRVLTVNSKSGSGLRYRVAAFALDGGRTLVVAVPLREVDQTLHRLIVVEGLVGGGVILALVLVGWVVIRVGLLPLERIGRVAGEIARANQGAGDESKALSRRVSPADSRTEVGRLGLSLNEMLIQIEQAFADRRESEERLRQFLADASHELRTPLASIRGYAEAFRLGAAAEPATLERAMARIEAEAARMGVLVEDLLLLASLDELPETRRAPVDLCELAEHAADDARAVAPDPQDPPHDRRTSAGDRRRRPAATAAGEPHPQRADPHPGGLADRARRPARARPGGARGPRPRTRPTGRRRRSCVRAVLARGGRAPARTRRLRPRPRDRQSNRPSAPR